MPDNAEAIRRQSMLVGKGIDLEGWLLWSALLGRSLTNPGYLKSGTAIKRYISRNKMIDKRHFVI